MRSAIEPTQPPFESGARSAAAWHPDIERVVCIGWTAEGRGAPYRAFGVVDIVLS